MIDILYVTADICDGCVTWTHGSGQVNGHKRMAGDEKVVETHDVREVIEHVAIPCDEPTEGEDGPYFRPATITHVLV